MTELTSAAIIAAVAFRIPLGRRAGRLPLPEPALEIVLGAVIGPQLLGWATIDPAVQVLSTVGICFLLLTRGVPALLYRRLGLPGKQVVAAGLLHATSLSLPAVAGTIGVELGLMKPETYVALITAGLISVLAFPPLAMLLGRRNREPQAIETP